ncbi:MAG: hypothetical protein K8R08_01590, partial [Methanosarcinales archaeon]|nr:hypothetical protein [Methanosarcinales archaeon]
WGKSGGLDIQENGIILKFHVYLPVLFFLEVIGKVCVVAFSFSFDVLIPSSICFSFDSGSPARWGSFLISDAAPQSNIVSHHIINTIRYMLHIRKV